jgi:hypothetical protein
MPRQQAKKPGVGLVILGMTVAVMLAVTWPRKGDR